MGLPAGLRRIGGAVALSTVLAACASGGASVEPSASPSASEPAPSETPLVTPPASASAAAGESSAPSDSEAAERTVDVTSPVEFSITVPGEWKGSPELSSSTTRTFVAGADRWVLFTQTAPSTADEWVERLSSGDNFTASEPEIVEIGGASGVRLDISVPDGQDDVVLIREAFGEWSIEAGRPSRVWILEVGGEVLVILTDAPERAFDSWTETVEEVLSTIVWAQ